MTSDPNDRTSRLRHRLETDRQQIEETSPRELERRRKRRAALHRGRYVGGDRTGERPAEARVAPAPGDRLSLFLGISGGSWPTMHWLWRSLERRTETLATLNLQIEEARWTLAEIEETTGGRDATGDPEREVRGVVGRHATLSDLDRARSACREAVERVS